MYGVTGQEGTGQEGQDGTGSGGSGGKSVNCFDLNARTRTGCSVLHCAAEGGSVAAMEWLAHPAQGARTCHPSGTRWN